MSRNPIAKDLRTPKYRQRVVQVKKEKVANFSKWLDSDGEEPVEVRWVKTITWRAADGAPLATRWEESDDR